MSESRPARAHARERPETRRVDHGDRTSPDLSLAPLPALDLARPPERRTMLALQSLAGNRSVARLVERSRGVAPPHPATAVVQREGESTSVTGVNLNHARVTVPPEAGLSLKASASPKKATGVTFKVEKGTVEPSGVTVDEAAGAITVADTQPGGDIKVTATSDDGASAWATFRVIEKPRALKSTSGNAKTGSVYGGEFRHTFSGQGSSPSGLQDARINEKFDSLSADTPFGKFTLQANAAGSAGWGLDASGTMNGDDNVTIGKGIKVGEFIKSASNPTPKKTLPQSFTMTQHMRAQSQPSGKWDDTAFTDIDHVRGLEDRGGAIKVVIKAGKKEVVLDYEGPPAYRNAKATPAKVEASPPKPKAEKGKQAPEWKRNEVTVTAEAIPATAKLVYSIVETGEARLGCEIDSASGVAKIGSKPGTITVRASDGKKAHYDEVKIEITAPAAPAAEKKAEVEGSGEAEEIVAALPSSSDES